MGLIYSADETAGYSAFVIKWDGSFSFDGLPSGVYKLTVTYPDGDLQTIDIYAIWPSSSLSYVFSTQWPNKNKYTEKSLFWHTWIESYFVNLFYQTCDTQLAKWIWWIECLYLALMSPRSIENLLEFSSRYIDVETISHGRRLKKTHHRIMQTGIELYWI